LTQNFNDPNAQCSQDDVTNFMTTVTQFMDNTDWVAAYFAFGMCMISQLFVFCWLLTSTSGVMRDMQGVNDLDRLMNDDGTPTSLGTQYINGS
jgi:hypothetical protein